MESEFLAEIDNSKSEAENIPETYEKFSLGSCHICLHP